MTMPGETNFEALRQTIRSLPYVQMLGVDLSYETKELRGHLPFTEHLIGNPLVPALHGGVIAALLHFTGAAQLMLEMHTARMPQIFTCTIEYLASPALQDCVATATIITRTRRFANLRVSACQPHSGKAIAVATMQYLTHPPG